MKRLLLILLMVLGVSSAYAQNTVVTRPQGVTSYNAASTVAVTNTFQSIWAASTTLTGRTGCIVQNTGNNPMYVYTGAIASATIAKSFKITAGQSFYCNVGNIVIRDQISITGTATETFFAIVY